MLIEFDRPYWVHKANLQPETGRKPNHVAVDETVIQLDDEQYWLYAAVETDSSDLLHTRLEPTRTNVIWDRFFAELRTKHDVDDAIFSVDGAAPLQRACCKHGLANMEVLLGFGVGVFVGDPRAELVKLRLASWSAVDTRAYMAMVSGPSSVMFSCSRI